MLSVFGIIENTGKKGEKLATKNFPLLKRSSDLSNSGEFERQTASEIAI